VSFIQKLTVCGGSNTNNIPSFSGRFVMFCNPVSFSSSVMAIFTSYVLFAIAIFILFIIYNLICGLYADKNSVPLVLINFFVFEVPRLNAAAAAASNSSSDKFGFDLLIASLLLFNIAAVTDKASLHFKLDNALTS